MIRRLGLWGGCWGRGKSLDSFIAKPGAHPHLQLDFQGRQDLCTNTAGEQAARMLGSPCSGIFGKSVPACCRDAHLVPNGGDSRYGQQMLQKVAWSSSKAKKTPALEGDVVPNAASPGPDQVNKIYPNSLVRGLDPKEVNHQPPFLSWWQLHIQTLIGSEPFFSF